MILGKFRGDFMNKEKDRILKRYIKDLDVQQFIYDNFNSVETIELVANVLDDLSLALQYEMETPKDKNQFNQLTSVILKLRELIKDES